MKNNLIVEVRELAKNATVLIVDDSKVSLEVYKLRYFLKYILLKMGKKHIIFG